MKAIFSLLVFMPFCLPGAEMEIRKYEVGERILRNTHLENVENLEIDYEKEEWLGPVVAEAPFETRFLKDLEGLRDFSARIDEILGDVKFEGSAVFDSRGRQLVVKTAKRWHGVIARSFDVHAIFNLQNEIAIYQVPGVLRGERHILDSKLPEGAKLITGLKSVYQQATPLSARTSDGSLEIEMESQAAGQDGYVTSVVTWKLKHPEVNIEWDTGFSMPLGITTIHEIGSLDGESTFLATFKTEYVTLNGRPADDWIQWENGGSILLEQRLSTLGSGGPFFEMIGPSKAGYFEMPVPMNLFYAHITYLEEKDGDPFEASSRKEQLLRGPVNHPELQGLAGGNLVDVGDIFRKNGIEFREGDFVVLDKGKSQLYAKLSDQSRELLSAIIETSLPEPPRLVRVDLMEVQLGDVEAWKQGAGELLRKTGLVVLPNDSASANFGEEISLDLEATISANGEAIQMRVTLSENGKKGWSSGITALHGAPVVIKESRNGDKRTAWVVVARVLRMDHEIRDYLEREEAGK